MTFDDGTVKIYLVKNISKPGDVPSKGLSDPKTFYFAFQNIGITRTYEAIKANQQIDLLIATYLDRDITTNDIAVLEDGKQYIIRTIQPTKDEYGIDIMKIGLERNGETYEIVE